MSGLDFSLDIYFPTYCEINNAWVTNNSKIQKDFYWDLVQANKNKWVKRLKIKQEGVEDGEKGEEWKK